MRKKTFNKKDLVEAIYNKIGYNYSFSQELVEFFFETLKTNLLKGQGLQFHSFGNFVLKDKKARKGRNPHTGRSLTISARRVLRFYASPNLKRKF